MDNARPPVKVDAVVTWVDGDDPAHRARMEEVLGTARHALAAAAPTRFGDCGEVAYCVASLLRFAPWLNTIHIVSDRQQPALMADIRGTPVEGRVRVVDHREIFAGHEQHLPTFSNRSIETMLWRIPGLAPRFLYLNDDFMLLRPVRVEDFFHDDGVVLHGHWRDGRLRSMAQAMRGAYRRLRGRPAVEERPGNHLAQQVSARLAGFHDRFFQVPHYPHPVRTQTCADWFRANPGKLDENAAYRLRSPEQFLTVNLAHHLELASGHARVDNRLRSVRLSPASERLSVLAKQIADAEADPRTAFICVQSLDKAGPEARKLVFDWLDRVIGRPCP